MLAPLVAVIVFLAVYPQLALHRSEGSVKAAVASAQLSARPGSTTLARAVSHTQQPSLTTYEAGQPLPSGCGTHPGAAAGPVAVECSRTLAGGSK